jgi:glycosyltransferase involved in cell wall biosynthesis
MLGVYLTVTAFSILKNEVDWIGYSIMSILEYIDEIVYTDGNSTDGTIELIEHIKKEYDHKNKIKLFKNQDCKNLKKDYTRLFNWVLKQCTSDYVMFWHADMIMINPQALKNVKDAIRYNVNMKSFVSDKKRYFSKGRVKDWAIIYKNDYGLHQYGDYGSTHEDFYFRDITGDEHIIHFVNPNINYEIKDSGIKVHHYCETKDFNRRLDKMIKSIKNINPRLSNEEVVSMAKSHPRVTLKNGKFEGIDFEIKPYKGSQPEVFKKYSYFKEFKKEN